MRKNKQKDAKILTMVTFIKPPHPKKKKKSIRKFKPQQLIRNETKKKERDKVTRARC
jgi:hypothetical protein